MGNYADFQLGTYLSGSGSGGLESGGSESEYPFEAAGWEAAATDVWEQRLNDYVGGGAGDERTQRANLTAFDQWSIVPRMLTGAAQRDLSVTLFGHHLPTPLLMSPIGVLGVMSPDGHGDIAGARAAAATGVPFIGSTLMQDPMEEVATHLGDTPGFFQLYTPADRELAESLVHRAEASGWSALVVTLDTWTLGYRPRDLAHGTFPQLRGDCLANYTSDPVFRSRLGDRTDTESVVGHWAMTFGNPTLTWEDLAWLRELTDLPLVLKGLCAPDDVRRAIDAGVDGVQCSNHGGRQAASGPALSFLPGVVAAAADQIPVIFDSGVRSGDDALKALALGASAVAIGRPCGWGAGMGGAAGIEHVLRCLLAELDLTMGLNGYASVAALRHEGALMRRT